jgi:hypothetical protein
MLFLDSRRAQRAVTLAITVIALTVATSIAVFARGNKSQTQSGLSMFSEWT